MRVREREVQERYRVSGHRSKNRKTKTNSVSSDKKSLNNGIFLSSPPSYLHRLCALLQKRKFTLWKL